MTEFETLQMNIMQSDWHQSNEMRLDPYKIENTLRVFVDEIRNLKTTVNNQANELSQQRELTKELFQIVKKIGEDYPEIVLAHPELFGREPEDPFKGYDTVDSSWQC